ncbi:hypothetical protein OEZ71_16630 [Defluviimonas sp. WL0050]|uniref:Uncharacterized protein n=1 Tax=Albidovulum litorale TaxID=2984134 RepID=A0ABT2ZRZ0_9RHOB|nr:hypothetical protein [Defluviimonas sp. WL0050]MCV2873924.1 hypothetical protein [Defluviimonas sp. WL0050]
MTRSPHMLMKAACFAVASLGAVAFVTSVAMPDAAYAKNGNGGGNGGGKGGGKSADKGGNGKGYGKGGNVNKGGGKRTTAAKSTKVIKKTTTVSAVPGEPLHPSELGKWNAKNANQAALDAHIRNQNFNGTIGALSQYQLAAKAAAGEELTEDEQAALDSLLGEREPVEVSDQELEDLLNADTVEGDPQYSVQDGVVSCSANCDAADEAAAQDIVDAAVDSAQDEADQAALDDLLSDSEARIVDESNKELSPERTEDLLDELASALGVTRALPVEDEEAPAEETVAE